MQLALRLRSSVLAPGELALLRKLYVIERGLVLHESFVLTTGKVWGTDEILLTDGLLKWGKASRARAMSFVELRELSRDDFMSVINKDPDACKLCRKLAVFVALRRLMIKLARAATKSSSKLRIFDTIGAALNEGDAEGNLQAVEHLSEVGLLREQSGLASPPDHQSLKKEAERGQKLDALTRSIESLTTSQLVLAKTVQGIATAVDDVKRHLGMPVWRGGHTPERERLAAEWRLSVNAFPAPLPSVTGSSTPRADEHASEGRTDGHLRLQRRRRSGTRTSRSAAGGAAPL